jgi:hypothetical protein
MDKQIELLNSTITALGPLGVSNFIAEKKTLIDMVLKLHRESEDEKKYQEHKRKRDGVIPQRGPTF